MTGLAVVEDSASEAARSVDLLAVARQAEQVKALGASLIASGLLPDGVKKPEAAMAIMLKGQELGLPPMYSLAEITIIQGKPASSEQLMGTLVKRAGHKLRVIETTEESCTVEGVRADDPDHTQRVTFTIEDARKAGLANKNSWKNYPRAMLRARAKGELCRGMFEDALAGMSYTPEELGAEVDAEGQIIEAEASIEKRNSYTPEHADLVTEIQKVLYRIDEDVRREKGLTDAAVFTQAEKSPERARAVLKKVREHAKEAGRLPKDKEGVSPAEESEYVGPEDLVTLVDILDGFYGDKSTEWSGSEWYEENVLEHPLTDLSSDEAKQLIEELEEKGAQA